MMKSSYFKMQVAFCKEMRGGAEKREIWQQREMSTRHEQKKKEKCMQ